MCFSFETCGPNEAMIITGMFIGPKPRTVIGGRALVCSCVQEVARISLNTMTLLIKTDKVYTNAGVPISVTGVSQVKIMNKMLANAAELYLGKSEREVAAIVTETLEGHQRSIMGKMTVEEVYKDRAKFADNVLQEASQDLLKMGMQVVSYTLKDVRDDQGYLESLGKARNASVKKDARIGEAENVKLTIIQQAEADKLTKDVEFKNIIQIAQSERDLKITQANNLLEVSTRKAISDSAYALQAAKRKQQIIAEEMEEKIIDRAQQIAIASQEIERQKNFIHSSIRVPAEAHRYKIEKLAEAEKNRILLEAEAEAEALRIRGDAEAFAIEAKAKAEAEQMQKRAEAWREYKDAALVDLILAALPKVAHEISAPMANTKKITMISSGQSEIGAARLAGEVMDIMDRIPTLVRSLTGVDIAGQLGVPPSQAHAGRN